jgi:hypothetical protein
MMAELKIGCLALVVKTYNVHENLGRSVVIERLIADGKRFRSPKTNGMCENASGETLYLVTGNIKNAFVGEDGWHLMRRNQLMPIDGNDFQHEDERQKELTHG